MTITERRARVEAAGQLYVSRPKKALMYTYHINKATQVFKLLSCLDSRFSHRHWTSTLRKYVTIHPAYKYMGSWAGVETSDFEYKDIDGELTAALVDQGYLQWKWRKRRPKYYINVKTTPGPWDEPFYLKSDAEYQKVGGALHSRKYVIS